MSGNIFHIVNRGVEKRKIFITPKDYLRFVNNLEDFNSTKNALEAYPKRSERRKRFSTNVISDVRRPIVNILAWCLMPNHVHLLVQEKLDGGASLFSKKIIGGYTKYFNALNKRSGVLFQGRSKIIKVKKEEHLICLLYYIFANPIKLIEPCWKERGIQNIKNVKKFLQNYSWSSFQDTIGRNNFPNTINKDILFDLSATNENGLQNDFFEWIANDVDMMSDVARPTSDQ